MTDKQNSALTLENYHNPDNPYSYGSQKTVQRFFPHLSKEEIDKTLQQSDVFTKYKQYRRPRQYLPIYVHEKRALSQVQHNIHNRIWQQHENMP